VPLDEQENDTKALPVTRVDLQGNGNKTNVVITSEMRPIDTGGPLLILLFCGFLLLISIVFLLMLPKEHQLTYVFLGISLFIFAIFFIRLQMGYFEYVRKVRGYVKNKGDQITTDVRRQVFKHKMK
jgi:hypothetical protein